MSPDHREIDGNRGFPSTLWSVILNARSASPDDYVRHMERLAEIYWPPVYSFIRHAWHKSHDDAKDLTQEFFASVILERKLVDGYSREEGGFRGFLRVAISRFMVNTGERDRSLKRGGGLTIASLEALGPVAFESLDDEESRNPEQMFNAAWREAVIAEAMGRLEQRLIADGRATEFEVFRRYDYDEGSADMSYADLAKVVGMNESQVRRALWNVRKMFRVIVTEIVGGYVDDPASLESELQSLFGA